MKSNSLNDLVLKYESLIRRYDVNLYQETINMLDEIVKTKFWNEIRNEYEFIEFIDPNRDIASGIGIIKII